MARGSNGSFLAGFLKLAIFVQGKRKLYDKIAGSPSHDFLAKLSPRDFRFLVGEYFRRLKFVVDTNKAGACRGVDLIARKGSETFFIQCWSQKEGEVDLRAVEDLSKVLAEAGGSGGIIVTSGRFARDVESFARAHAVRLVSGRELHNQMKADASFGYLPDTQAGKKRYKTTRALAVILPLAIAISLLWFSNTGSRQSPGWASRRRGVLEDFGLLHANKENRELMPAKKTEAKDLNFTDAEIEKAKQQVLSNKSMELFKEIETGGDGGKENYFYQLELAGGSRVSAADVKINGNEVTYRTDRGLVFSLNREEVKSITRIRKGGNR